MAFGLASKTPDSPAAEGYCCERKLEKRVSNYIGRQQVSYNSVPAPTPSPASNHSHERAGEVGKAKLPHPTATPKTQGHRGGRSVHGGHRAVTSEFLIYK